MSTARGMSLPELLDGLIPGVPDVRVFDLQLDSRRIAPGQLFVALPGQHHDGRDFIRQAVAGGAAAVIAEPPLPADLETGSVPVVSIEGLARHLGGLAARFFGDPAKALAVLGVTGTNGKTTCTRLVAQLLRCCGQRCGVIGTLGATLGDDIAAALNTTPDAIALQRQLADWREAGVDSVAMEVSSHALDQGRVDGLPFRVALFTNLSRDHLDYHGSMAAYGQSKMKLFLSPQLGDAVINLDDAFSATLLANLPAAVRPWTYSATGRAEADIRVLRADFHSGGVRADVLTPWGEGSFDSPLPGDFNLANVTAAIAAAVCLGAPLASVLAAVSALQPVPGRMELVANTRQLQVVIDYAHTPDALAQVLAALRPHVEGELHVVFGCGGDRDPGKRPLMGEVACRLADRVLLTSDNPRGEDPEAILDAIEAGCERPVVREPDRARAIHRALAGARPGDCVVIAGKGHEDYQILGDRRVPFSDRACARDALSGGQTA